MRDRKLPNGTPVMEAVLECRIKEFSGLNSAQLEKLKGDFSDHYPKCDHLQMVKGEFTFTPTGVRTSTEKSEPNALILKSEQEKDLLRVRLGSLVAIRLEPYEDWAQLTEPVLRCLEWLIDNAGISTLERVGARFVNRFTVPQGTFDIEEWLNFTPNWPDDLAVVNFLTRYTAEHATEPFVSTVTQTIRGETSAPELILDIDTFAMYSDGLQLAIGDSYIQQLESILSELRGLKNEMFYRHVTEKALEPYL